MRIVCKDTGEVGNLVRRCAEAQKKNGGCYNCLFYPFCVPEHDFANRKQVEDICSVVPDPEYIGLAPAARIPIRKLGEETKNSEKEDDE